MRYRSVSVLSGSVVLFGFLLASLAANAQVLKGAQPVLNVKLGLWENTVVTQTSGAPQIDTSRMTPEQRARLEAALQASKQHAAMPHTVRACVTREKLQQGLFQDNARNCKQTMITNSPTILAFRRECAGNRPTSEEFHFEAVTPESIKGTAKVTADGNRMTSSSTMTAKWVGPSCGDVK